MGNTTSFPREAQYSSSDLDWAFAHPPLVLDVQNMPFLQPPEIEQQWDHEIDPVKRDPCKTRPKPAFSPEMTSISLVKINSDFQSDLSLAPSSASTKTQWKSVKVQKPVYCIDDAAVKPMSPHAAHVSIASQLSVLSNAGLPLPLRSDSLRIREILKKHYGVSLDSVDANTPPPVPPHYVFGASCSRSAPDSAKESALAAIESLEQEVETDESNFRERPRRRSVSLTRARSRSRSLSRQQSLCRSRSASVGSPLRTDYVGDLDTDSVKTPTDVYTRRCQYPASRSSYQSVHTSSVPDLTKTDNSDSESDAPHSPGPYFALDGYSEGSTTLRVINFASEPHILGDNPEYESPAEIQNEPLRQYRVKSKALIVMEKELLARKRYARYGQTFHGGDRSQFSFNTPSI